MTLSWLVPLALASGPDGGGAQDPQLPKPLAEASEARMGPAPADPMYFELSASTGGDFYFWAPGEFAGTLLRVFPAGEPVVLRYGDLGAAGGSVEVTAPVDSTVGSLNVFAGIQDKGSIRLLDPGGRPLRSAGTAVEVQETRHMALAAVLDPGEGNFRVQVSGRGRFAIAVRASPFPARDAAAAAMIDLVGFDFVEQRGRPGHEGLFPVRTEPAAGATVLARVVGAGDIVDPELRLVGLDGVVIATCPPTAPGSEDEWLVRCRIPDRTYRVVLGGTDARGNPFLRSEGRTRSATRHGSP